MIIAEVASAHRGDIKKLEQLLESFNISGVDFFKFQLYEAIHLGLHGSEVYSVFDDLTIDQNDWIDLLSRCPKPYIMEVFDLSGLDFCENNLNSDGYKIHTTNIDEVNFIKSVAETRKILILSVSGLTDAEVVKRLHILECYGDKEKIYLSLGHQSYPTKLENLNIGRVSHLANKFDYPVIFADHSDAETEWKYYSPMMGIAAGAAGIEKHVVLSRPNNDNDFYSALEPSEFKIMVSLIKFSRNALGAEASPNLDELTYRHAVSRKVHLGTDGKVALYRKSDAGTITEINSNLLQHEVHVGEAGFLSQKDLSCPKSGLLLIGRTGSDRLHEKAIKGITCRDSVVDIMIRRIKKCRLVDETIMCTSNRLGDDILHDKAVYHGISCFRGSENNVLERILATAKEFALNNVVRLTCDNPLYDPDIIDSMLRLHIEKGSDFTYNEDLPVGMRPEIYSVDYLTFINKNCNDDALSEYITFFVQNDTSPNFKKVKFTSHLSGSYLGDLCDKIRLTVDYAEDIDLIRALASIADLRNDSCEKILSILNDNQQLLKLNQGKLNPLENSIKDKCQIK